ncbi:hypothetical protein ACYVOU_002449 [Vibrio cholerae]
MQFLTTFLILASFSTISYAESVCLQGSCENGTGVSFNEENNWTYAGEFKNGKKHGEGVERTGNATNFVLYNGSFLNNVRSGKGVLLTKFDSGESYVFGTFSNNELEVGSIAYAKVSGYGGGYYKVESIDGGKANLSFLKEETANHYCSNNPFDISCITRFVDKNQNEIAAILAVGYFGSVLSSKSNDSNGKSRMSFDDIANGIESLNDYLYKRSNERALDFSKRISAKLGIPNR